LAAPEIAKRWGTFLAFTMRWHPGFQVEAAIYARYILRTNPKAKIAVLYQNDDFGRRYLKGFKDGLGPAAAKQVVAEASYAPTDPTVASQVLTPQASGADTFADFSTAKAATQSIREAYDRGWKPLLPGRRTPRRASARSVR
jgi:branched-chain amino acid transport system substrate-binding protein